MIGNATEAKAPEQGIDIKPVPGGKSPVQFLDKRACPRELRLEALFIGA